MISIEVSNKIYENLIKQYNLDKDYVRQRNNDEIFFCDKNDFEFEMLDYIYDEFGIDSDFYYEVDDVVGVRVELKEIKCNSLREFIEKEIDCKIELNDRDLINFLNYENVYIYDNISIKNELQEDLSINSYLIEFIDIKNLAIDQNYKYLDDDCYVDNEGLYYLKYNLKKYYNNDINELIKEWRD